MVDEFNLDFIEKVRGMMEEKVIERMDKIAIKTHNYVSIDTPVDYGQARAGWNFTKNSISTKVPKVIKEKARKTKGKKKVKAARPQVLEMQKSIPDSFANKIGDRYHVTNAVNHTLYLNEGISPQAPDPNWIERDVARAVADVEKLL